MLDIISNLPVSLSQYNLYVCEKERAKLILFLFSLVVPKSVAALTALHGEFMG